VDFDIIGQPAIRYSALVIYWKKKKKWDCNGTLHQIFIDFEKVCDSFRREILYSILIKFDNL